MAKSDGDDPLRPASPRLRSSRRHSLRYSAYTGGPDPLAPPVDLRDALEQIGQDVMAGASPRRALSELLRRGTRNLTGADRLAAEVNRRRRELLRRNNLDGTLQEIKKLLDEAVLAERKELARALDDDARFAELQLDALPASPAKAVQELAEYRWRSGQAREKYEQIKDLLGRELLDQRFAGMKQALAGATDDDRRRVTEMLDDLNDLLDKHARGEDTQRDFDEFMTKHGEFFPENPRNVEELLDSLAKRAAAAQRFRNSLSQEQRDELDALAQQAFGSPALMRALDRLDAHLQAARPGEDWTGSQQFSGDNPFGMGEGPRRWPTLPSWSSWPSSCRRAIRAPAWTMSTWTRWPVSSATRPPSTPGRWLNWNARWSIRASWTAVPTASGGSRRRPCAASAKRRYAMWRNNFPGATASVITGVPAPRAS
ncbi:von Willebrand factor type A [Mycobacterium tuberculosis]|nr:von Willebrand factor type A [Mycobacterium tuberculosis]